MGALTTDAAGTTTINAANVELGGVTYSSTGRWTFTPGVTPLTSARVTVNMTDGSASGPVQLFFGRLFGVNTFSPAANSTAAFVRNKICLCFDRSRSMTFDMSGTDERWPASASGWPYGMPNAVKTNTINCLVYPPCNGSRWANLSTAANTFLNALTSATIGGVETKVALITWGASANNGGNLNNRYYNGATQYTQYHTYPAMYTDCTFVTPSTDPNYNTIRTAISTRNQYTMLGGTDMNAGLQAAVDLIRTTDDGLPYNKIIILFSDGEISPGLPSATAATDIAISNNILVHTIGLLNSGPGFTAMQDIANRTGGRAYLATDAASLQAAFEEMARTLPVILTE